MIKHTQSKILLTLAVLGLVVAACSPDKPLVHPAAAKAASVDCSKPANSSQPTCKAAASAPETDPANPAPDAAAEAEPKSTQDFLADVTPAADADAIQFFVESCVSCHDAKTGSVKSFWPLDQTTFTKQTLATDTYAPTIFFSLLLKAKDIVNGRPSAMPPKDLSPDAKIKLKAVLKWMEIEMPAAVQDAQALFGGAVPDGTLGVGVAMNYKCTAPATFRDYVRRITNDVFDREPTAAELKLGAGAPDDPVTLADRVRIATRLFNDDAWHEEFEDKGLRKFAQKLSGAADLAPVDGQLTADQVTDLKDEFYQVLKASYATVPFKDILLSDTIKVTARTASLYTGCTAPTTDWGDCQLKAPRGSYFSSMSFLRSKPSSFLRTNNNYGRAAVMIFVIRGDVLKAGFDQSGGTDAIKPLPACLKTKDFRGTKGTAIAWHGSGAVPLSANLCQACHIARQMAAGSVLFRPFNPTGLVYGDQVQVDATDPDFLAATGPTEVIKANLTGTEAPVDKAFLASLLASTDGTEQACVQGSDTVDGKDLVLQTVKDLATYLIGPGNTLAGGLARHLPRAMSNLNTTSEEIIVKINQAFADGGGRLEPLFKAYFESETYSCKQ